MTKGHPNNNGGVAKANNVTILSNEYVEKTRALLEAYGEIAIINFQLMWNIKYDEIIDFVHRRYKGGLLGFLRDNNHLFELTKNRDGFLVVSLISRPVSRDSSDSTGRLKENITHDALGRAITKQRSMGKTIHQIFNESNYLWGDQSWRIYLKKKDISIAFSAYESALDVHPSQTKKMVDKIHATLKNYPQGLKITEIYKCIDTMQALKIFNVSTSVVALVDELPEVFYRTKVKAVLSEPEQDLVSSESEHDLVFDGSKHTIEDLTGNDDKIFVGGLEPEAIASQALNHGLYQKTLLLIRETGQVKGLKINVWMKSMKRNFYVKNEESFQREVRGFNALTFFLALARYELIELESHERVKNDIRAFLPRKFIDYSVLKVRLNNLINLDSNSEDLESISDDTTNTSGEPQTEHVTIAKSILKVKQN